MTCSFCGGAAHPATGCFYGYRTLACYSCVREFWGWAIRHVNGRNKRWPRLSFYECATRYA